MNTLPVHQPGIAKARCRPICVQCRSRMVLMASTHFQKTYEGCGGHIKDLVLRRSQPVPWHASTPTSKRVFRRLRKLKTSVARKAMMKEQCGIEDSAPGSSVEQYSAPGTQISGVQQACFTLQATPLLLSICVGANL